jgi:hypothetical protein
VFQANEKENQTAMIIYGVFVLLFQPIFKIALGQKLWNLIDVVVGIGILITVIKDKMKNPR